MLYQLTKNILFKYDPEQMHNLAIECMQLAPQLFKTFYAEEDLLNLSVNLKGLAWKNPIGLAAGLDKNAKAIPALTHLGFAAIEVGTVTKSPQLGNPTPRIFRYPNELSLRNSMGFPNEGAEVILKRVKDFNGNSCIGVNLGKNKDVSDEEAIQDQADMAQRFAPFCDYLVVNISSPNTSGLRDWQHQEKLNRLLKEIQQRLRTNTNKPLFVKISPDLTSQDLAAIVEVANSNQLHGIIATNTTIMLERGTGGISGELLSSRASLIRSELLKLTKDSQLVVIGVGGLSGAQQILDFLVQGGDAVQLYSALVFHGPALINKIKQDICHIIKSDQSYSLKHYLGKRRNLKWS